MLVSFALCVSLMAQAPSPAEENPPVTGPREQSLMLVLDVGGDQVPMPERAALTEAFTLALARRLDLEVQSPRSLMDRVNFAERQQQAGCDSSACMAEIANAMGARFVVFSRVVQLGDDQVLRADIYDNAAGRSVALAAVEAGSVTDLTRRLPGLVDDLIVESRGALPLRTTERPIELKEERTMSPLAKAGVAVGGVGLGLGVVGGAVFGGGLLHLRGVADARDAYLDDPTIDNARAVVASRVVPDDTVTLTTAAGGCVGAVGLLGLAVGGVILTLDTLAAPPQDAESR